MGDELPNITHYVNTSNIYEGMLGNSIASQLGAMQSKHFGSWPSEFSYSETEKREEKPMTDKDAKQSGRRIVQVFICDPDSRIPLEKSLIYRGDQKLTDATDQELFYEVDIHSLLKDYNDERKKMLDKKATERAGRDVFLDPVKIRELRMVVSTLAEF